MSPPSLLCSSSLCLFPFPVLKWYFSVKFDQSSSSSIHFLSFIYFFLFRFSPLFFFHHFNIAAVRTCLSFLFPFLSSTFSTSSIRPLEASSQISTADKGGPLEAECSNSPSPLVVHSVAPSFTTSLCCRAFNAQKLWSERGGDTVALWKARKWKKKWNCGDRKEELKNDGGQEDGPLTPPPAGQTDGGAAESLGGEGFDKWISFK